jgi:phosphomethylpyrimidine synthase
MTLIESAKKNIITELMRKVAVWDKVSPRLIRDGLSRGKIVIPKNNRHNVKKPVAIGEGLFTKINANVGTSTDKYKLCDEIEKVKAAVRHGADTLMDLSVGRDLVLTRRQILKACDVPVGTVPIYEIAVNAQKKRRDLLDFGINDILETLESQARDGVDFFTIHSGVTRKSLEALKKKKRLLGIVSRGGAILASWIAKHKKENPMYEHFERILDIAYKYDITLSLGDGLRPGSVLDATDKPQIEELKILGKLAKRAQNRNVQVMIEGPGHVPLNQIEKNIKLQKEICHGAPFYVLGPLVTDVASGYDHISAAIGGAMAAGFGADFLCYVTPSEHLRHPSVADVRAGVIASKIAAHAGDIVKRKSSISWDREMSLARCKRDWKKQIKLSIDPDNAAQLRRSSKPGLSDVCTMCGEFCSIKLMEDHV